jgi:hypothetical protein
MNEDGLRAELPGMLARLAVASAGLLAEVQKHEQLRSTAPAEELQSKVAEVTAWLSRAGHPHR